MEEELDFKWKLNQKTDTTKNSWYASINSKFHKGCLKIIISVHRIIFNYN